MIEDYVVKHAENIGNQETTYISGEDFIGKPATQTESSLRQSIIIHKVINGQTIDEIAAKYNLKISTIKWVNNLSDNELKPGQKLQIPPVDGVSYTVKANDTAESIARQFGSSALRIININDAEIHGLKPGSKIIIPDGKPEIANNDFGTTSGSNIKNGFGSGGDNCTPSHIQSAGRVNRGDVIGRMGSTGSSTGKHLHFSMCENDNLIDPIASRKDRKLIAGFSWPVRNHKSKISRWFDCTRFWAAHRGNCPAGWYFHAGVDITEPYSKTTDILAIGDGEIIFRGYQFGSGYTVIIRHDNGYISRYFHMLPF